MSLNFTNNKIFKNLLHLNRISGTYSFTDGLIRFIFKETNNDKEL